MSRPLPHSTSSAPAATLGRTQPRLWTPPLRDLTPDTSYGFDVIDFADQVLGTPLDEWEELAVIHAGELLPDGRPRFRTVLIIVARQNGKTLVAKTLICYWLFVEQVPLVLGTSSDRSYAKLTWADVVETARTNPWLRDRLGPAAVRLTLGEEVLTTLDGAKYRFAANNRRAGRSTTVHRWVCDELREHSTFDAWSSATNTMNAVPDAQTVAITNMGDDSSVVLDSLRDSAIEFIETGVGDRRLGLLEWSAPPGADPTDLQALAYANPNLGRRIDPDALLGAAVRAKRAGGLELAAYRTEVLCERVHQLDPAIDPDAWTAAGTDTPLNLAEHRQQVALCLDVALDGSHATLVAAAVVDGLVHLEVVAAWTGYGCTAAVRRDLPAIVAKVKPRTVGWFPAGPAAAVAAAMTARPRGGWPPRRVELAEIKSDAAAVCMGLAEQVGTGQVRHPKDEMLTGQVSNATRQIRGDTWVFARRGTGPIDGVYAAGGAAHLARTLPPPPPALAVV